MISAIILSSCMVTVIMNKILFLNIALFYSFNHNGCLSVIMRTTLLLLVRNENSRGGGGGGGHL